MKKRKNKVVENFWFKKYAETKSAEWSWIPANWKGWTALILLIGINTFAANYFQINKLLLNSWLKFSIVFLVSLFVFILIAQRKTQGVKIK